MQTKILIAGPQVGPTISSDLRPDEYVLQALEDGVGSEFDIYSKLAISWDFGIRLQPSGPWNYKWCVSVVEAMWDVIGNVDKVYIAGQRVAKCCGIPKEKREFTFVPAIETRRWIPETNNWTTVVLPSPKSKLWNNDFALLNLQEFFQCTPGFSCHNGQNE